MRRHDTIVFASVPDCNVCAPVADCLTRARRPVPDRSAVS
jgi:hypothetical protein